MQRRLIRVLPVLSALAFASAAFTQEATTTSAASSLVITTTDPMVAMGIQRMFDAGDGVPEIGDGKALVLSLDDGGKLSTREAAAGAWLTIEAKPAVLMKTFKQPVTRARMQAGMIGGMALGQAGIDAEAIDDIMDAVFDFPNQIEAMTVSIPRRYEAGQQMDIDVDLMPKTDTWFNSLVVALKPHAAGLRRLPGKGAMMQVDADFDFAAVLPQLTPMVDKMTVMMISEEALRTKAIALMKGYYKSLAGPMSMTFDFRDGMRATMELSDPAAMNAALTDPTFAEITKASSDMTGGVAEITPNAITHRDIGVTSTVVELDDVGPNPLTKDGQTESFSAIAGNAMVVSSFGDAASNVKSLIDQVLDNKLKRTPLGKLMTMSLDLGKMVDFIGEMSGGQGPDANDIPAGVNMGLAKTDKGLHIEVRIK